MGLTEALKMLIEVAVFSAVIYVVLRFLRETRGAGVVRGLSLILTLAIITFTVLINLLDLRHLEVVFTALTNITILGLIIVFQPEIRRAIVHLGESPIFARFRRETRTVPRLLRGVARLSKDRVGALIAIERDASLADLTASGIRIDAEVNSYLVESIFVRSSPLHDGAIVIRDNRIEAAKCLLPLSESTDINQRLGTRHRAAVGLSEESDALAIVVSEETGAISFALNGKLMHDVALEELEQTMEAVLGLRREV
ncbi:MAG: diadenylate cyclase CdaA [Planctomycetota bacterium]